MEKMIEKDGFIFMEYTDILGNKNCDSGDSCIITPYGERIPADWILLEEEEPDLEITKNADGKIIYLRLYFVKKMETREDIQENFEKLIEKIKETLKK